MAGTGWRLLLWKVLSALEGRERLRGVKQRSYEYGEREENGSGILQHENNPIAGAPKRGVPWNSQQHWHYLGSQLLPIPIPNPQLAIHCKISVALGEHVPDFRMETSGKRDPIGIHSFPQAASLL